jgi:pimeloyl-ACP methyl ester carboxylesterase
MSDPQYIDFDGHRVAYRVAGGGPALVVLHLYRRKEPLIHLRVLSDVWQVFEISPLGYGRSDRVPGYAGEFLVDQVLAVLDHHRVQDFVVWGYSKGGAMASCIARATPRAAALVCGGYSQLDFLTDGVMRRLDRRLRADHPSRSLWPWVQSFDWREELTALSRPALFYWGSDDRQMARGLRRARELLWPPGIEFLEFAGLDHGSFDESALGHLVIPAVREWIERAAGPRW